VSFGEISYDRIPADSRRKTRVEIGTGSRLLTLRMFRIQLRGHTAPPIKTSSSNLLSCCVGRKWGHPTCGVVQIRFLETTHGHVSKLFVRRSCVDVRKYFFGNRAVKNWNSLPATVEDFASLRKFKSFIEHVDLSQYVNF